MLFVIMPDGICLSSRSQALTVNMCVNLRGIQALVAEHLLQSSNIHAVLEHHGGGGVTQLMRRAAFGVQTAAAVFFTSI